MCSIAICTKLSDLTQYFFFVVFFCNNNNKITGDICFGDLIFHLTALLL